MTKAVRVMVAVAGLLALSAGCSTMIRGHVLKFGTGILYRQSQTLSFAQSVDG